MYLIHLILLPQLNISSLSSLLTFFLCSIFPRAMSSNPFCFHLMNSSLALETTYLLMTPKSLYHYLQPLFFLSSKFFNVNILYLTHYVQNVTWTCKWHKNYYWDAFCSLFIPSLWNPACILHFKLIAIWTSLVFPYRMVSTLNSYV